MPKLVPMIILEGLRLTFKTKITVALNEHPYIGGPRKYRYPSPLIRVEQSRESIDLIGLPRNICLGCANYWAL